MFTVRIKSYEPNEVPTYFEFEGRMTSKKYSYILEEMLDMASRYSSYIIADIYPQTKMDAIVKLHDWDEGKHCIELHNVIGTENEMVLTIDCNYIKTYFVS